MKQEIWAAVVGYEGLYKISNLGRIKTLCSKYRRHSDIIFTRIINGYETVCLRNNGKSFHTMVHRVIAMAFIPNPENKPCVNHINGFKSDNRIENLEWATHAENTRHAVETGLLKGPCGEKNGCTVLTNEQAKEIYNSTCSREELAVKHGVTEWVIGAIKRGERWHTITGAKRYVPTKKKTPLSEGDVIAIYTSSLTTKEESKNRDIDLRMIQAIRSKRRYFIYTKDLDFKPLDGRIKIA